MRLLDLFCGAGGAAMGYHRAGFNEIVGVDIKPQPRYPFTFVQGDALNYLAEHWVEFDAFHASPPCQRWSIGNRPHGSAERHPDFIRPVRRWLKGLRRPWVIENVALAPMKQAIMLCGTMFGLQVFRHRLFESNVMLLAPAHVEHDGTTGSHRGYSTARSGRNGFVCVAGHNFERQAAADAMGIDWMHARWELAEAIPPAYTEFIGRQLFEVCGWSAGTRGREAHDGRWTGEIITVLGSKMGKVVLDHCQHGTDACFVKPGDIRQVNDDDQYV